MILNGKLIEFKDSITIKELLQDYDLDYKKVVVEVNEEIILKEDYYKFILKENDKIEVISFVGGG